MSNMKKICSLMLALVMAATCVTAAAEPEKHERVYAVCTSDGGIDTLIDSVYLENTDGADVLNDRTQLTDITNVGGHESFTLDGETLTWISGGNSIRYQGHSDKQPAVIPVVTYTLDGNEIAASDAASATGNLTITVTYPMQENVPCIAVSVLPVPAGMTVISLENAALVNAGAGSVIAGLALPGFDGSLGLPASFSVNCSVDHAELSWMLTAVTSEPLKQLTVKAGETMSGEDAALLSDGAVTLLTALKEGAELPEFGGALGSVTETLTNLLSGTAALTGGAAQVNEGATSIGAGVSSLQTGLAALTENNGALNAGAAQLFGAILNAANAQLAAAGLGADITALTEANYAEVLDSLIASLQAKLDSAPELARASVAAAVEANRDAVTAAVTEAVKGQVLTGVLAASGAGMTAEEYSAAVNAGKIEAAQAQQTEAIVTAQLGSPEISAQIEAAVSAKLEELTAQQLESAEVKAQLETAAETARAAIASLNELKTQLDSVNAFVTGLGSYTAGVSEVKAGVDTLAAGTDSLAEGTAALAEGAAALDAALRGGLSTLADKYLPALEETLDTIKTTINGVASAPSFDLAAEGTKTDTVYIIRTVMDR